MAVYDIIIQMKAKGADETAFGVQNLARKLEATGLSLKTFNAHLNKSGLAMTELGQVFDPLTGNLRSVSEEIRNAQFGLRQFRMEWLSILFFSQQMSRVLGRTMSTSIKTFSEIAGESNRANQGVAILNAQFTYLRFSLGRVLAEALLPLIPAIVAFTDAIVNFIQENPEAVIAGLTTAFVSFFALFAAGSVILFKDAIGVLLGLGSAKGTQAINNLKALGQIASVGIGLKLTFDALKDPGLDINNILAPALIGMGLGKKAGIWSFALTLGLDFLLHPEAAAKSAGVFLGHAVNIMTKIIDVLVKIWANVPKLLIGIIKPRDFFKDVFTGFEGSGAAFVEGFAGTLNFENQDSIINTIKTSFEGMDSSFSELTNNVGVGINTMFVQPGTGLLPFLSDTTQEWTNMSVESMSAIDGIISRVEAIPKEVVTVHRIVEVRETRSPSGLDAILRNRR